MSINRFNTILTFTFLFSTIVLSQEWQQVRIDGMGFVSGIIASQVDGTKYVRTDVAGVFKWDEAYEKWISLMNQIDHSQAGYSNIESFACHPTNKDVLYAAVGDNMNPDNTIDQGVVKSLDGGLTWDRINFPDNVGIHGNKFWRHTGERLAIDPVNANYVYFGSRDKGLFRTTNAENNNDLIEWTSLSGTANPTIGNDAGTGMAGGQVYVVIDGTETIGTGELQRSKNVYVGVVGDGIWLSKAGGDAGTFVKISGDTSEPSDVQYPVRATIASNGTLYSTFKNEIWKYEPSQDNWTNITPPYTGEPLYSTVKMGAVAVHPNNPNKVYFSIYNECPRDILVTEDGGLTWKIYSNDNSGPYPTTYKAKINYSIPAWYDDQHVFNWSGGLLLDPLDPDNTLWITNGFTTYRTQNLATASATENLVLKVESNNLEELVYLDMISPTSGTPLLSGVADRVGFRHESLEQVPEASFLPAYHGNTGALDFCWNNGDYIVRVSGDQNNGISNNEFKGGYSTNNGQTWNDFASTPLPTEGNTSAFCGGKIAVASTTQNHLVWWPDHKGNTGPNNQVHYSSDGGTTWNPVSGIEPHYNSCASQFWFGSKWLVADRAADNTFFAYSSGKWQSSHSDIAQLYKSTDGGKNWQRIYSKQNSYADGIQSYWTEAFRVSIESNPRRTGDLFITFVDEAKLVRWNDTSAEMTPILGDNANTFEKCYSACFGPPANGDNLSYIYVHAIANGTEGIFLSKDDGLTYERISSQNLPLGKVIQIIADPKKDGRLYAGTNGRGLYYFSMNDTPVNIPEIIEAKKPCHEELTITHFNNTIQIECDEAISSIHCYDLLCNLIASSADENVISIPEASTKVMLLNVRLKNGCLLTQKYIAKN